jgi:hypothetical protein
MTGGSRRLMITGMRAGVVLALLAMLVLGCASPFEPEGKALGRIESVEQAGNAAIALTTLGVPVSVLEVRSGVARQIYTGAYPSWALDDPEQQRAHDRFLAKLDRMAWRVTVASGGRMGPTDCCAWEELIIDQETGSLLFSVSANRIPNADGS